MRLIILFAFLLFASSSFAQREVKLEEINNYIGDSVQVRGFIKDVRFLESAKNSPTFISFGKPYPDQTLTVVIWGDIRKKIHYVPTQKDFLKFAIVAGRVELEEGVPQIIITTGDQLKIIEDAEVPAGKLPPTN